MHDVRAFRTHTMNTKNGCPKTETAIGNAAVIPGGKDSNKALQVLQAECRFGTNLSKKAPRSVDTAGLDASSRRATGRSEEHIAIHVPSPSAVAM